MPLEQIAVQSTHAAIEIARNYLTPTQEHPSVIILQIKNEEKLNNISSYLDSVDIKYKKFKEPDPWNNNKLTAIATVPLYGDDRKYFKKFQLLRLGEQK